MMRFRPALAPVLGLLALCVAACDSATTSSVATGPTPAKCQLTLGQPSTIVAGGGTGAIGVTAQPECAWTVDSQPSWISDISPTSGQGNGSVGFRAASNPAPSIREGDIVVNDIAVRLRQEAAPCRFAISPDDQTLASSSGTATVVVSALDGCTWTAESNASWITVMSGAQGNGNGTVTLGIGANSGSAPRTGTVTIAGLTHTISQRDSTQPPPIPPPTPTCTYAIAPNSESLSAGGGTGTAIAVTAGSGCAWTAVSNASWITITSGSSGTGNGSVSYLAAANTGSARSGTMTIAGHTFTVEQAAPVAPPCTYTLSASSASYSDKEGKGSVSVTAAGGCAWTAVSNASWITITSGASGTGNGRVDYTVAANTGGSRSGTITIGGRTFTVDQDPQRATCTYALGSSSSDFPDSGGTTGSVDVKAQGGCAWTATSNASWITIASGASGSGNGKVAYTVEANTGAARSGTMTIAGQTFTVNQAAAPAPTCTYTLSASSASSSAAGGTGFVNVTAPGSCAWTAVSNTSWITIPSGASGTGNDRVDYAVEANTGAARSGTMTIAGHTFTVNQAAFVPTCTYSLSASGTTIPADGGTGSFDVTAPSGCAWTAVRSADWITITAGARGNGNGTVSFSVTKENKARTSQSADIVVQGQTFTVTQLPRASS